MKLSMPPNFCSAVWMSRKLSSGRDTSATIYAALSLPSSFTAPASAASLRPASISLAPSRANNLEAANPIPLPAPVNTTTLLASRVIVSPCLWSLLIELPRSAYPYGKSRLVEFYTAYVSNNKNVGKRADQCYHCDKCECSEERPGGGDDKTNHQRRDDAGEIGCEIKNTASQAEQTLRRNVGHQRPS